MVRLGVFLSLWTTTEAAAAQESTCGDLKKLFQDHTCCDAGTDLANTQIRPVSTTHRTSNKVVGSTNPCENAQQDLYLANKPCFIDSVVDAVEASFADVAAGPQSGADVTKDFVGEFDVSTMMNGSGIAVITNQFRHGANAADGGLGPLCPVNVHWHLGAEHKSGGQYDEAGTGPSAYNQNYTASAEAPERYGFACHHYDEADSKFTTPYEWKHCKQMKVGETYEVHWPHSVLGACGTPHQYQTKFYDGLFCNYKAAGSPALTPQQIASNVGVQAQVFTIVNDEDYYYPDLMKGMILSAGGEQKFGEDLAIYAGSSTGTTRDDMTCSAYSPVTWQVDRTCHLISASSFDKMCADMKQNHDPMDNDLHAHGARKVVAKALNSDEVHEENHADRR